MVAGRALARFIVEVIDQLDLSKLTRRYSGSSSAAYHPAMMLALLVYGYASGTFSSRKIERATYDSVAFRFIAANHHPDHDTLAHFRKTFLVELEGLFVQVLSLAQAMKLVKLGQISLDGTKIKANASKHKALSHGHIEQLEAQLRAEVQALLKKAADVDQEELADGIDLPAEKLQTQSGRALYGKRKSTVKPVFGIIKQVLGFHQFSLRGLDAVTGEWKLVTMAFNLKRMHVLVAG